MNNDAQVHVGDCLEVLEYFADNSIDAIVTDPPYGLSFMGKRWDYDVPSVAVWAECLRVLKPGGHLLAFAGTRTQHRMAVRIEDAGFEIRDMVLDLVAGDTHVQRFIVSLSEEQRRAFAQVLDESSFGGMLAWVYGTGFPKSRNGPWGGTALKPALEPITVARKPMAGTVAANFAEHGTGGLNIYGCKVEAPDGVPLFSSRGESNGKTLGDGLNGSNRTGEVGTGRWPANLIHDGSDEVLAGFPETGPSPRQYVKKKAGWLTPGSDHHENDLQSREYGDSGSAARFFYCAKASKRDRDEGLEDRPDAARRMFASGGRTMKDGEWVETNSEPQARKNNHPTVKPTDLMRYLCRLVTPPGGVVLDPFTGSGSTGKAAILEGFRFIGIEREAEYVEIARARILAARNSTVR